MADLYRRCGKRLLDVALALAGLVAFALPMAWIAWRIRRESGGPILFKQIRLGWQGAPFMILKFRTMSDDGIVSPLGRRLRATAMDELPQLINILMGQMSFVGPRPLIPEDLEKIGQFPEGKGRFLVRPGLTGLAQINSAKSPNLAERLSWDLRYVERCALGLDGRILLRSIGVTAKGGWEK